MKNTIVDLFEEQVKLNPDGIAVFDENRKLTRKELLDLVNTIAIKIPESTKRVGILMNHSVEMIASILAVLKRGAAYIPIEPSFPVERTKLMLEDSDAELVLTDDSSNLSLKNYPVIRITPDIETEEIDLKSEANSDDLAYILYTSGSTGKPKGVSVLNRNVTNYIRAFQKEFSPTKEDTILQYSVCTFDIFVEEVFSALLSGMTLAIPSAETKEDLSKLLQFIENNNVTIISGFPYLLLDLNENVNLPSSIRLLISGGDILREDYITNLIDKVKIYNTYGPSETTVCASYFCCNNEESLPDGTFPIGKAVSGCEIEILDENLNPVEDGEIGEICITGNGVSAGYYDKNLEENSFFFKRNGKPAFLSGDLGYFLPDGNIAFIGRKDLQVMIGGKRVEPEEVENIINQNEKVKKAVVSTVWDKNNPRLIAYVVFRDDNYSVDELRQMVSDYLPEYMIPEKFVKLDEIPMNSNGKVDLKSLPKV